MIPTHENPAALLQDPESLWNDLDVPGSEAAFRGLLSNALLLDGCERSHLVLLLSWIARAEALQERLRESLRSLIEAEGILKEQGAACPVPIRLRWLIERGRFHLLEKTPSQARAYFSEAWTLSIESGEDYYAVEIAQLMATSEPRKARRQWIELAIEVAKKSRAQKTKKWLGSLYSSLGWNLYHLRQFEKSLETFREALNCFELHGTEHEAFLAQWSIGKLLRVLGRAEEALVMQKALLAKLDTDGRRDGRLYEELAECLQTMKRATEAQFYFELAFRELSNDEWIADNQPVHLKRLKDLGKVK